MFKSVGVRKGGRERGGGGRQSNKSKESGRVKRYSREGKKGGRWMRGKDYVVVFGKGEGEEVAVRGEEEGRRVLMALGALLRYLVRR